MRSTSVTVARRLPRNSYAPPLPPHRNMANNKGREKIKAEEDWYKHRNCGSVRSFSGKSRAFSQKGRHLTSINTGLTTWSIFCHFKKCRAFSGKDQQYSVFYLCFNIPRNTQNYTMQINNEKSAKIGKTLHGSACDDQTNLQNAWHVPASARYFQPGLFLFLKTASSSDKDWFKGKPRGGRWEVRRKK